MDGPGPSTQANRDARSQRAARRASGEAASTAQGSQRSQRAPFPYRGPRTDDDGSAEKDESSEEESSEDEDDDGEDGGAKTPVRHHEIWKELLKKGKKGGLRYAHREPAAGDDPLDITAVESTQTEWDMTDRRFWPDELPLWKRPTPWTRPTYEIGVLKHKGRVVLDWDNKPIRNFRIPLTISSEVEGLRIEAWMRHDDRLTFADIAAREWTKDVGKGKKEPKFDRRALSKRASNARTHAGLISWAQKKGREEQTKFMHSLRASEQIRNNLATDKDLTSQQKAQYALIGLKKDRQSEAPTRAERIRKIERTAAGTSGAVAGPSSGAVEAASGDDDSLADDADSDQAVEETLVRDQPSEDDTADEMSISSSLIDPLDSRHDQPATAEEQALLQGALENTVEQFLSLTGQEPQPTNPGDNYFSQWGMLQEQHRRLWTDIGNPGEAPRLVARDRWTGGISQYPFAEVMEGGWDDDESEEAQEEGA